MTHVDRKFAGEQHETLPHVDVDLSCKSDNPPVNPEVVVDVNQDGAWIRIPVTKVEEWINKDGPADMTRTAKVRFPYEWGDKSVIKWINGFNSQNELSDQDQPYDECRIFYYDHELDSWVASHYGYIGGIGPGSESEGMGKFWVYDPADLMKGIQVSKNWSNPSLRRVVDFAINGVDNNGNNVGLTNRAVFDNVDVAILGAQKIPDKKSANVQRFEPTVGDETFLVDLPIIGSYKLPIISDVLDVVTDFYEESGRGVQKRFQINRHNMVDHMDWVTSFIDARWWFEPSADGPVLVIDATAFREGASEGEYTRRYFVDEQAVSDFGEMQLELVQQQIDEFDEDQYDTPFEVGDTDTFKPSDKFGLDTGGKELPKSILPPHNYEVYAQVDTLNNSALEDIKPFNTLYLWGESTTYNERFSSDQIAPSAGRQSAVQDYTQASSPGGYTREYPYVKVTYEPLVKRSGGYEYSAKPVESTAQTLETAEREARREFRKHLAEVSEGSMEIKGEPHIMPFDYIYTVPTCNDTYVNANAEPMTWEVNGVKHTREAGERFTTELGVSLPVHDRHITVESEYQEA